MLPADPGACRLYEQHRDYHQVGLLFQAAPHLFPAQLWYSVLRLMNKMIVHLEEPLVATGNAF